MRQPILLQASAPTPVNPLRPYYLLSENDLLGTRFFFSMFGLLGRARFFLERGNVRWYTNVTLLPAPVKRVVVRATHSATQATCHLVRQLTAATTAPSSRSAWSRLLQTYHLHH